MKRLMSRFLSLLLCAALMIPLAVPLPAAAADNSFGNGLSWNLESGCLTISGSGAIPDYSDMTGSPWFDRRYEVTRIVLKEGITAIGDYALSGMDNVTSVSLPDSLTEIGTQSMSYMSSLTSLKLPASVKTLGPACFGNCGSLTSLTVSCYNAEFTWLPYGFRYDPDVNDYVAIPDVTLYGYTDSTAQTYAQQYDNITFVPLNSGGISGSVVKTEVMERTDSRDLIHIRTVEQLRQIADAPDANYVLDNDLVLPSDWTPIPLSGTFEGQNYTISFTMTGSATGHYGLFSTLSGSVSNLKVRGSITASGNDWIAAGLLAADCTGIVRGCSASGSVTVEAGTYGYAGGLTGRSGSFDSCSASVDVSLTTTASSQWATVGGLSGSYADFASSCTYDGELSLTQPVSAPNLQASLIGIAISGESPCVDCTVSGTMTMNVIDAVNSSAVALNHAVSCVNKANISATTHNELGITGCLNAVNCRNEGDLFIQHMGSEGYGNAIGLYAASDSSNSGAITANSANGNATAIAIDAAFGANLYNSGTATATAPQGTAVAAGIRGAAENCSNAGAVSSSGDTASACGVEGCADSENTADISAHGTTASAIGICSSTGISNGGDITASATGETADAYGVYAGSGFENSNSGAVHASTPAGYATARGVHGGQLCSNTGRITASGRKALAYGLDSCSYSTNYTEISVLCDSTEEGSSAQAIGVSGGTGNKNLGDITADTYAALNKAAGCLNCSDSMSSGDITAKGTQTVNAFGLQGCKNSFSSGTITAQCDADSMDDSASAYGHTGGYGCSSTASVRAYSDHFSFVVTGVDEDGTTHYHLEKSGCQAGNAGSASLIIPGLFNISQSGEKSVTYYAWLTTACGVYGVFERPPTEDEVRENTALQFYNKESNTIYYYCAEAPVTTEGAPAEDWTAPEAPQTQPDPEPESGDFAQPIQANFYYKQDENCPITAMTNALGSFQFFNGAFDDFYDPSTTDYRTVYLRLRFVNGSSQLSTFDMATLKLPDGFSFDQNEYTQTNQVISPILQPGTSTDLWIPVYPLYSTEYADGDTLRCTYTDGNMESRVISTGCTVNVPSKTANLAKVNYYLEKAIDAYYYVHYKWNENMFDQSNTSFHQNINELAALLSSIIYFTNDDPTDALDALAALGFSCLQVGGINSITDCRHHTAQKTIVTENGEVQQLVILPILGTSNGAGWIGNLTFLDMQNEHLTFLTSAQDAVKTLDSYLNLYRVNGQELKLLVTGHSRGAAAANLAGDIINRQYLEEWDNIYVYTYATPHSARPEVVEAAAALNNNIFNVTNLYDVVGYVPGCYDNHGISMFYKTDTDNIAPLYIIPLMNVTLMRLPVTPQGPLISGFATALVNYKRILQYHLMHYYVEDLWGIMPEQIYTYDAAMTYMEDGYRAEIEKAAKELAVKGAVRLSDLAKYMAQQVIGDSFGDTLSNLFSIYRYTIGAGIMIPLNMLDFYKYPVMDSPLEINCPVDLEIYDEEGQLIGEVKNDQILSGSDRLILSVIGDKKSLILLENETYIIKISGYDSGTMDLRMTYCEEDEETLGAIAYTDIPVSPNTTITARMENGVLTLLDNSQQTIQPETLDAEQLTDVTVTLEESDSVSTLGSGTYISGQQVLIMAASEDEDAVFAGWYEGDTLISSSAVACITCDHSMTLTPRYLSDPEQDCILNVSRGSGSISASVCCQSDAVLWAAAYDENGQLLWADCTTAVTGTVTLAAPADVLAQAADVKVFLLEPHTFEPLCPAGSK